jgi:hypothetical protein
MSPCCWYWTCRRPANGLPKRVGHGQARTRRLLRQCGGVADRNSPATSPMRRRGRHRSIASIQWGVDGSDHRPGDYGSGGGGQCSNDIQGPTTRIKAFGELVLVEMDQEPLQALFVPLIPLRFLRNEFRLCRCRRSRSAVPSQASMAPRKAFVVQAFHDVEFGLVPTDTLASGIGAVVVFIVGSIIILSIIHKSIGIVMAQQLFHAAAHRGAHEYGMILVGHAHHFVTAQARIL